MMSNETDAHGFRSGDATNTSALPTPSLVLSRPVQGTPEVPFEEATLRVCVTEHLIWTLMQKMSLWMSHSPKLKFQ